MKSNIMNNRANILDTGVSTDNLGDLIIVDSILKELKPTLDKLYVTNVSTHDRIGAVGRKLIKNSPISLLLGTNVLTSRSRVNKRDMWRLKSWDVPALKNKVLLCGVGWRNYQTSVKFRQKSFYRKVLNSEYLHSVRDSHAKNMLNSIGINNVINTTCPTTWGFTPEFCQQIPTTKADKVVFTLTRHKRAPEDSKLVESLLELYNEVYFWPQQIEDYEYLSKISSEHQMELINIIPPSLNAYDSFLKNNEVDFIGTRLHGGIRALQFKRRALILGIDNRAKEISQDINLPVVDRKDVLDGISLLENTIETDIKLPVDNIEIWKKQFEQFYQEKE